MNFSVILKPKIKISYCLLTPAQMESWVTQVKFYLYGINLQHGYLMTLNILKVETTLFLVWGEGGVAGRLALLM